MNGGLPQVGYIGPTLNAAQCEALRIVLDAHDGPLQVCDMGESVLLVAGPRTMRIRANGTVDESDSPEAA